MCVKKKISREEILARDKGRPERQVRQGGKNSRGSGRKRYWTRIFFIEARTEGVQRWSLQKKNPRPVKTNRELTIGYYNNY